MEVSIHRILVPTDFSVAADEALDRAAWLAMQRKAELTVFHVDLDHGAPPERVQRNWCRAQARLSEVEYGFGAATPRPPLRVRFETRAGESPYAAIQAEIEENKPDLVVMATHGGGLFSESVAERVVRNAKCHILASHRSGAGWPLEFGRIVVAIDFSENSRRALDYARVLAEERAPLTVLYVDDPSDRRTHHPDQRELDEWLEASEVDEAIVVQGDAPEVIVHESRRRHGVLVVLGVGRPRRFPETFLGSVAERVIRRSPVPVLAVR